MEGFDPPPESAFRLGGAQAQGEPVEQLGMGRRSTLRAEIVRCGAEPLAEGPLPNSVCRHAGGQGVRGVHDPPGEAQASTRGGAGVARRGRGRRRSGQCREEAGGHFVPFPAWVSAHEQARRRGLRRAVRVRQHVRSADRLGGRPPLKLAVAGGHVAGLERGGEGVVIRLGDGVELVVVAARAPDGEAQERRGGGVHQIVDPLVLVFHRIVGLVVPSAESQEPGGDQGTLGAVREFVAGQLLQHEPIVGNIAVDAAHDPVAVLPGERLGGVALVAVGVGVSDQIEPMARLALGVGGARKQAIHHAFVGSGASVGQESREIFGGRREPREVVMDPSEHRASVGRRCFGQPRRAAARSQERVHGRKTRELRNGRIPERLVRPDLGGDGIGSGAGPGPRGPRGARFGPAGQILGFVRRQGARGRHRNAAGPTHRGRESGRDARGERLVDPDPSAPHLRAVAGAAPPQQDRSNPGFELGLVGRGRTRERAARRGERGGEHAGCGAFREHRSANVPFTDVDAVSCQGRPRGTGTLGHGTSLRGPVRRRIDWSGIRRPTLVRFRLRPGFRRSRSGIGG